MNPSAADKLATLIIVSYNAPRELENCLLSIEREKLSEIEVIIIDNNSPNPTVKKILSKWRKKPTYKVIFNSENVGFGRANNQAARIAQGKWLILANNDTYWNKGELKKLLEVLKALPPWVVALGPKILSPNHRLQQSAGYQLNFFNLITWAWGLDLFLKPLTLIYHPYHITYSSFYQNKHSVGWLAASFLAVKRQPFLKVGGFPQDIFMYGEDVLLGQRLSSQGQLLFSSLASFYHIGQASSSKEISLGKEAEFVVRLFSKRYGRLGKIYAQGAIKIGFFLRFLAFSLLGKPDKAEIYRKLELRNRNSE